NRLQVSVSLGAVLSEEQAEEIAAMVAYLAGPEAGFVTGASLTIDGGGTPEALAPGPGEGIGESLPGASYCVGGQPQGQQRQRCVVQGQMKCLQCTHLPM